LKLALHLLAYGLLALVLLVLVYCIMAFILSRMTVPAEPETKKEISIYLLTNGVHTDIVVPVKSNVIDWTIYVKYNQTKGKDTTAQYLGFGWGDKGFYLETPTWADLKPSTAVKAMTGLSSSAIHATFLPSMQENKDCKKIDISLKQYKRLANFIIGRFDLNAHGESQHIETNANYGLNDAFYEAKGSYNLFYTCNTWANAGLKACGQKAAVWTPFYQGIFYHYK
jgi:uncharacterized protein (TIGR02117 family)